MNQEAFDTFWYWINERHKIYEHRIQGYPLPWSEDPIFQNWRFCNVFRLLDKQTQYLVDNVLNRPVVKDEPSLLLFNIFLFRSFNWYPTYDWIKGYGIEWDPQKAFRALEKWADHEGNQLTSGAYMIRGREGMPKYQSIVITLNTLWFEQKAHLAKIAQHNSIQELTKEIVAAKLWGWGPFTSYQVALDCSYSSLMPNPVDINTWCEFGPGAIKGIKCIYPEISSKDMLEATIGLLSDSPKFIEKHVPPLTLQDIEFSLCELGKYLRIRNGGKGTERYAGT